jgi:hypothetical protein
MAPGADRRSRRAGRCATAPRGTSRREADRRTGRVPPGGRPHDAGRNCRHEGSSGRRMTWACAGAPLRRDAVRTCGSSTRGSYRRVRGETADPASANTFVIANLPTHSCRPDSTAPPASPPSNLSAATKVGRVGISAPLYLLTVIFVMTARRRDRAAMGPAPARTNLGYGTVDGRSDGQWPTTVARLPCVVALPQGISVSASQWAGRTTVKSR